VVVCLGRGADMHMAQLIQLPLTIFCSSKWVILLFGVLEKNTKISDNSIINVTLGSEQHTFI